MTVTPLACDAEVSGFLQGLDRATVVAMDTETTGLSVINGKDYLMGFSLAYRVEGIKLSHYFPVRHKEDNYDRALIDEVLGTLGSKQLVFFNRKFDLHSIETLGRTFIPNTYAYDCLLLAHMINEEWPMHKSLDNVAKLYIKKGKVQKDEMEQFTKTFGWGAVPPSLMRKYACGDAEVTLELFEQLWKIFVGKFGQEAEELWSFELAMQNTLFGMEQRGVGVDLKFCRQYAGIADLEMVDIENDLGFQPSKSTALSKFLFEELKLPVLDYTPGGKPSMAKDVMNEYDRMLAHTDDPRARQVLNYRGWQKASSTFYKPFQTLADSNGKIHCNYKQHGTHTGRLSCAEPNLQQIPRLSDKAWNGKIRSAFVARPGYRLVGFDYSQLEFRLAAAYGQDQWLIDAFADDDADVFTELAERIGTDRFTAKTFTYAMIYGAGKEKIAKTLNRSVDEIESAYNNFVETIPGILRAKSMAASKAKSRGYIRYWTGRRRHFRNPEDAYKAFNSLLQGGAAECVKRVMIAIDKQVCNEDCVMLLQVHDELVFEIKEELVDEYSRKIKDVMERIPSDHFHIRFTVSAKQWGDD